MIQAAAPHLMALWVALALEEAEKRKREDVQQLAQQELEQAEARDLDLSFKSVRIGAPLEPFLAARQACTCQGLVHYVPATKKICEREETSAAVKSIYIDRGLSAPSHLAECRVMPAEAARD